MLYEKLYLYFYITSSRQLANEKSKDERIFSYGPKFRKIANSYSGLGFNETYVLEHIDQRRETFYPSQFLEVQMF